MALRKAGAYSKKYARPYTRVSKRKGKSYIKTVPPKKIIKFQMGKDKLFREGKLKYILKIRATEQVQIRDNSIEAVRQTLNRNMEKQIPGQFYFEIKIHPHHILRENKMLTGAGSDRMQTGMQLSFGKTMGRAAMVKANQDILFVAVATRKAVEIVRAIFTTVKPKLPCKVKIIFEKRK